MSFQADPKAMGTGAAGGGAVLLGWMDLSDWSIIIGIATAIVTCVAYVWATRRRINILEDGLKEDKRHNDEIEKIRRGDDAK